MRSNFFKIGMRGPGEREYTGCVFNVMINTGNIIGVNNIKYFNMVKH